MKKSIVALLLCTLLLLTACSRVPSNGGIIQSGLLGQYDPSTGVTSGSALGDDEQTFGESIEDMGAYDGYFEGESSDILVSCVSGTQDAYRIEGSTLTFSTISEASVYSICGTFSGNIVVDVGDEFKFDLELHGLSLNCGYTNPINVISGDEVGIKAKKDTKNYIYDTREAIDTEDETLYSSAIYSAVDLEIGGKGELTVVSENNNGIHSKDDLQIKNLTLFVSCVDNALKGNDGVEISGGNTTLISTGGDCIKSTNSDISSKGNQRGDVVITGGTHTLYAACDGIDAAHNVSIDDSTTVLNIYTDKYSNYSKEVTANSSDINYIRFTSNKYYYSVKYYNSEADYLWVNAEYHSSVSGGRSSYYYYSYPKMSEYAKVQFFIYESASQQGQQDEYLVMSEYLTQNTAYDTFALAQSPNGLSYQWTNYTTTIQNGGFGGRPGGMGGMQGGNTDKSEYSTKGIKAANEIVINAGTISIKSYDDAIHANNDTTLENAKTPLGNVSVYGGTVNVYSNDDGIHADGTLTVKGGRVSVLNSYEGLEGTRISIEGGNVSVVAKDDGINSTATSGVGVSISGGTVYVLCAGDGIDSNSRTSYSGIAFSGGKTVIISNSSGDSAIDTEQGYSYTGGYVLAIMPRGGMTNEAMHAQNFSSIGSSVQTSLTSGTYLVASISDATVSLRLPVSISSAFVVLLGDSSASVKSESTLSEALDENGVAWH